MSGNFGKSGSGFLEKFSDSVSSSENDIAKPNILGLPTLGIKIRTESADFQDDSDSKSTDRVSIESRLKLS